MGIWLPRAPPYLLPLVHDAAFQLFALFLVSSASQISSVTLVDALSADPDYTSIIRLLQRARLIPTLNRLNGSTFFAPTSDAIERHISKHPLWHAALHNQDLDQRTLGIYDNVADWLWQQLFYHLLNYTLPAIPADSNPEVHAWVVHIISYRAFSHPAL
jgi:solute carrier family 25 (mitochondrial carnitine/acylcarnitine transporter), member 20/29